jgi:hypothetical protein
LRENWERYGFGMPRRQLLVSRRSIGVDFVSKPMKTAPKPKKFVTDRRGQKIGVVLSIEDYKKILADIEELESIRAYDAAKASGDEAIPFQKAMQEIERSRK